MKKFKRLFTGFFILIFLCRCGISEDCLRDSGEQQTRFIQVQPFTSITIFTGVSLIVKQGPELELKVVAGKNIIDDIKVVQDSSGVVIKNNSTCNLTRSYDGAKVYLTTPDLRDIISNTDKEISTDGVLTFPYLHLASVAEFLGGYGTGDFRVNIENQRLVIESNHIATFYMQGHCDDLSVNIYNGLGRVECGDFPSRKIQMFMRGSNDIVIHPLEKLTGDIYGTGNVISKTMPDSVEVIQHYTGHLIFE